MDAYVCGCVHACVCVRVSYVFPFTSDDGKDAYDDDLGHMLVLDNETLRVPMPVPGLTGAVQVEASKWNDTGASLAVTQASTGRFGSK